jgi:hypothetical protein
VEDDHAGDRDCRIEAHSLYQTAMSRESSRAANQGRYDRRAREIRSPEGAGDRDEVFVGLSVEEVGPVLGISPQSVMRDWKLAKAWLKSHLEEGTRSLVSVSFLTRADEGGHIGLR